MWFICFKAVIWCVCVLLLLFLANASYLWNQWDTVISRIHICWQNSSTSSEINVYTDKVTPQHPKSLDFRLRCSKICWPAFLQDFSAAEVMVPLIAAIHPGPEASKQQPDCHTTTTNVYCCDEQWVVHNCKCTRWRRK